MNNIDVELGGKTRVKIKRDEEGPIISGLKTLVYTHFGSTSWLLYKGKRFEKTIAKWIVIFSHIFWGNYLNN